jgi:hypothetical protein
VDISFGVGSLHHNNLTNGIPADEIGTFIPGLSYLKTSLGPRLVVLTRFKTGTINYDGIPLGKSVITVNFSTDR